MVDMVARLKELREKKAAEALAKQSLENNNAQVKKEEVKTQSQESEKTQDVSQNATSVESIKNLQTVPEQTNAVIVKKESNAPATIGTARTSEIDHLAFMSNLQELQEAIHTQHPKMPVLLMMIHKHLRTDPELVTTLSEEEIGVIVNGLKIQTKTELTGTVLKAPKTKKTNLSTDMF